MKKGILEGKFPFLHFPLKNMAFYLYGKRNFGGKIPFLVFSPEFYGYVFVMKGKFLEGKMDF